MKAYMSDRPLREIETRNLESAHDGMTKCVVGDLHADALWEVRRILAETEPRIGSQPDAGLDYLPVSWIGASVFTGKPLHEDIGVHGSFLDKAGVALTESLAAFIALPIE